jgi:hypothetical protein
VRRLWVPLALTTLGVTLLIGCIPIPGSYQRVDGRPRPEESLGEASSKKPLRKGTATRHAVYALLGAPSRLTADRRAIVYDYAISTQYAVGPLCVWPTDEWRHLRVDFDANDIVSSFKVIKSSEIRPRNTWAGDERSLVDYVPVSNDDPPPAPRQHLRPWSD